jgi:hypothetical protein
MRRFLLILVSGLLLAGAVGVGVAKAQAIGIAGKGSTGLGGLELQMAANLLPNGGASGHSRLTGGATGNVVQVVPPSALIDYWCINVQRTDTDPALGDQRINWYIRDVGDGKTTFDQISFVSSIGGDCTTFPTALGVFLPLTDGDYKAHGL